MATERPATYPEDSVQAVVDPWWTKATSGQLVRGRLLWAFVPFVGLTPRTLEAEARSAPTEHGRALFRLAELRAGANTKAPKIPVAALPNFAGETYAVYRSKRRPVLLLSVGGGDLPAEIRKLVGKDWKTEPSLLVAPYFGVDPDAKRAGWHPNFVSRIRRGEYPHYSYDTLPVGGPNESILRLDQLQPIGRHHNSYELTDYVLTPSALAVMDEWLAWLVTGMLDPEGTLAYVRREIASSFPDVRPSTGGSASASLATGSSAQ